VHHSVVACFYAPSDLCGASGMYRERIRSNPNWHGSYARYDTVFVETDAEREGMLGMSIGGVFLFFSFTFQDITHSCALVHWLSLPSETPDRDTSMWVVTLETHTHGPRNRRVKTLAIIPLDSIAHAAHLLPIYSSALLPEDFHFSYSLDVFQAFYINKYVDHQTFEFLL
ncbi:hypothetical protein DFH07DRAFT_748950, partial [Mycena maculata]